MTALLAPVDGLDRIALRLMFESGGRRRFVTAFAHATTPDSDSNDDYVYDLCTVYGLTMEEVRFMEESLVECCIDGGHPDDDSWVYLLIEVTIDDDGSVGGEIVGTTTSAQAVAEDAS